MREARAISKGFLDHMRTVPDHRVAEQNYWPLTIQDFALRCRQKRFNVAPSKAGTKHLVEIRAIPLTHRVDESKAPWQC